MTTLYQLSHVHCAPLAWQAVAQSMLAASADWHERMAITLYGVWRSQIGLPRDVLTVITVAAEPDRARQLLAGLPDVQSVSTRAMRPTLRPATPAAPVRQGNYAFRYFETPAAHWDEFLTLCERAWPGFESAYDSQVIGLWRYSDESGGLLRSQLLTRRPDLAMWERSKLPQNEHEAQVRRDLSRRYDLCTGTVVYTTTLLSARDRADSARWT